MLAARSFKIKQKKIFTELYAQWGLAKTDYFNFDHISIYNKVVNENSFHQLSEQTKNDIDFDDLFCLIETICIKLCKVIPIESYFIEFDLVPGCVKTLIIR